MGGDEVGDRPMLRVVDEDERAVLPRRTTGLRRIAVVVGVAALAAFVTWLATRTDDRPAAQRPATTTTVGSKQLPPLPLGATTTLTSSAATTTTAPTTAVPSASPSPQLVPVPVAASSDGDTPAEPPTSAPPTSGSARVRIFNAFSQGRSIEVWEVSGTPVRYGTLPYGGYAQVEANGALLPAGVSLRLRFVTPGGDPLAAKGADGPWSWDLAPAAGSAQTLVLVENGGLGVRRIDDRRAASAGAAGRVHLVPIAKHLVLSATRAMRWGVDGSGCVGPLTTEAGELDVAPGAALRLYPQADSSCADALTGPVVVPDARAVAVIGVATGPDAADLVALPLG